MNKTISQPSVFDFFKRFPTEESAREYFEEKRWGTMPVCPKCGCVEIYRINDNKIFQCKSCKAQFTVRTGTIMERSRISLQKWLYAMYLFNISRKSISSVQLAKEVGITQKSAWFLLHRLQETCITKNKISGTVEIDEAYIGGKEKNKHANKKAKKGCGPVGKTAVFGAKSRDGEAIAFTIPNNNGKTLKKAVAISVSKNFKIITDAFKGYNGINRYGIVNHSKGNYVNGDAHTNGIESLWANIKRTYVGIHHYWSDKHLDRYVVSLAWRLSTSRMVVFGNSIDMFSAMIKNMEGKTLSYKGLING